MKMDTSFKDHWVEYIHNLQNTLCDAFEEEDGKAAFREDRWKRKDGGGGITRVIQDGDVIEKGGINTSVVYGPLTDTMKNQLNMQGASWFACGLSLIMHPVSPMVPTIHCNYRMFELYDDQDNIIDRWFGGGTDLTPYYLFEEDAIHFHNSYKKVCDAFDPAFYPSFKKHCDDYFVNWHRNNERRGIGGIFYDHQRPNDERNTDFWFGFGRACGDNFLHSYLPVVQKRKDMPYDGKHKYWQEIRRGRYVEFNLVHDRGTTFGLKTNGRTESILMSLPPRVRFDYDYHPLDGSEEEKLLNVCLHPREWAN